MVKITTKEQEIDEAIEDVRVSMKANLKAREAMEKCQVEINKTHFASVKANQRLRSLLLESY